MHFIQSTRSVVIILIASIVASIFFIPKAGAIGISPPIIQAKDILRNSAQTHSVTILIEKPAPRDIYFAAVPRGEYAHYVKGPAELVIPQGQTLAVYSFDLEPIDAPVGSYSLQIAFTEMQKDISTDANGGTVSSGAGAGARVAVLQGAILVISMSVSGEEKVSYEIQRSQFEDTEPKIPLVGSYTVYNSGNVEWKPDSVEVVVTDIKDPENTETYTVKGDELMLIKPGKTVDSKLMIPHNLVEGKYRAKVKFFFKGLTVAELETSPFNVFPVGTLSQSGELVDVTTNKQTYNAGEQVVIKGIFKNTGDVTVQGQLETQIYKDGSFVNLEVSRVLNIDRKQEAEFQQFFKLNDPGNYELEVTAMYGNRKTQAHRLAITVTSSPLGKVAGSFLSIILVVVFTIAMIIFLIIFAKKRKEKIKQQPKVPEEPSSVSPPAQSPETPQQQTTPEQPVPEIQNTPASAFAQHDQEQSVQSSVMNDKGVSQPPVTNAEISQTVSTPTPASDQKQKD